MTEAEPHQPDCDGPDGYDIVNGLGEFQFHHRTCCSPPPTPAQLRRRAEDDWLARQRNLATAD